MELARSGADTGSRAHPSASYGSDPNGSGSRPFDVYLVGSAYSGSTFLGQLVAAHLDAAYVGEAAHLPAFVERYGFYERAVGCLPCASEGAECPIWTEDLISEAEQAGPAGSMNVLRRAWGTPVVIDGSKWPGWLRLAMEDRPADSAPVAAVIVVRSPLSFAVSASAATGAESWQAAQWWRDVYLDAIRTVNRLQLPVVVVRNENARQRPLEAVQAVARLVGQQPVSRPGTASGHSLGGNLWVHRGYSTATWQIYESLGLSRPFQRGWRSSDWERAAREASSSELIGPKTEREALGVVQAVFDCPGLGDVANLLGYEMASVVADFLGRHSDTRRR